MDSVVYSTTAPPPPHDEACCSGDNVGVGGSECATTEPQQQEHAMFKKDMTRSERNFKINMEDPITLELMVT